MNSEIGIKLNRRHRKLIEKVARNRGEQISTFTRRAILKELSRFGFLTDEEERALGISKNEAEGNDSNG